MLQRMFALIGLLTVMTGFQNCAQTEFASTENSVASKSSLIPVASDDSAPAEGDVDAVLAQEDEDEDASLVACILDGPGKSVKLGLSDDSLGGVNAVSKSVCISVKACVEIVPKLFAVKGPEDRGYCAHNPNVIRLTDAEVQALVDAALKK